MNTYIPGGITVNQTSTKEWKGEMLISTRKIWCNIKKYWLLGAVVIAACAAMVVLMTVREYRADLAAASLETYQGEALVYIGLFRRLYGPALQRTDPHTGKRRLAGKRI